MQPEAVRCISAGSRSPVGNDQGLGLIEWEFPSRLQELSLSRRATEICKHAHVFPGAQCTNEWAGLSSSSSVVPEWKLMEIFNFPSLSHKMPNPILGRSLQAPNHRLSELTNMPQTQYQEDWTSCALLCLLEGQIGSARMLGPWSTDPWLLKLHGLYWMFTSRMAISRMQQQNVGKAQTLWKFPSSMPSF